MSAVVIVPTYNERNNLAELTERLMALRLGLDVLFIDDGSPDGTGEAAEELARKWPGVSLIQRGRKLGLGSALVTGYRAALERNYSLILQMDADLSHDPAAVPGLMGAAANCDLVLGSRYVNGVRVVDWEMNRVLLSYTANRYARAITGLPLHDLTTGFRCFRKDALEALKCSDLKARGYGFQIETAYRVWKQGGRLREYPIIFYGRQQGKSKLSKRIIFEAAVLVWRLRFSELAKRKKIG